MSDLFQISEYNGVYGRIPFGGAVERDEALKMLATLLSPAPLPEPQQGPRGEMYGPYALTPVKEDDFLFLVMLSDYDNDRIVSGLHASQKDAYRAMLRHAADCGLEGLSMGMSGDFEVAIAEGATHIRVGSAIFGARA